MAKDRNSIIYHQKQINRMEDIVLIGAGGHAKSVIEAVVSGNNFRIYGLIDANLKPGEKVCGLEVIGDDSCIDKAITRGIKSFFIAVGSIGKPDLRVRLFEMLKQRGVELPNIIHPSAVVSRFSVLGKGNFVGAKAVINAGAVTGNNCIINTSSVIEHDCELSDFVHLACGAVLSGGVRIGARTHIGAGSCVSNSLEIGSNTIIGSGSVVTENIPGGCIAFGNPCKLVRKNE